jgi:hypothetical protein
MIHGMVQLISWLAGWLAGCFTGLLVVKNTIFWNITPLYSKPTDV